jgi:hypothetical protein
VVAEISPGYQSYINENVFQPSVCLYSSSKQARKLKARKRFCGCGTFVVVLHNIESWDR